MSKATKDIFVAFDAVVSFVAFDVVVFWRFRVVVFRRLRKFDVIVFSVASDTVYVVFFVAFDAVVFCRYEVVVFIVDFDLIVFPSLSMSFKSLSMSLIFSHRRFFVDFDFIIFRRFRRRQKKDEKQRRRKRRKNDVKGDEKTTTWKATKIDVEATLPCLATTLWTGEHIGFQISNKGQ